PRQLRIRNRLAAPRAKQTPKDGAIELTLHERQVHEGPMLLTSPFEVALEVATGDAQRRLGPARTRQELRMKLQQALGAAEVHRQEPPFALGHREEAQRRVELGEREHA